MQCRLSLQQFQRWGGENASIAGSARYRQDQDPTRVAEHYSSRGSGREHQSRYCKTSSRYRQKDGRGHRETLEKGKSLVNGHHNSQASCCYKASLNESRQFCHIKKRKKQSIALPPGTSEALKD